MRRILLPLLMIFLFSCTNHPTVLPGKLEPGEKSYAYSFSVENVVPVYTLSYGLNKKIDISGALGLPIWGSGVSLHYLISSDTLKNKIKNAKFTAAWHYQHNSQYEISYLKESYKPQKKNAFIYGLRGNYIPEGISGDKAVRFGLLTGILVKQKVLFEIGYTHDFQLETEKFDPVNKWPTEHHYLTGISFKLSVGDFRAGLD